MRKQLIHLLSSLFPGAFARIAYNHLTHPQVRKLRDRELSILDTAQQADFAFKDFRIKTYTWENDGEAILLIHGWEGQAGNFSDLVQYLLAAGYKVYAFDGPSHGFSSKGNTSLFEFTELVGVLIKHFGVRKLISHSFGGVATTYALAQDPSLEIDKYALLTTPDRFSERIADVIAQVGVSHEVQERLIHKLESELDVQIDSLNVSNFVQQINVREALIIHDLNDQVIPIAQSRRVHQNWPVSSFETVAGTGHFRILRTPEVLTQVVTFLED